MYTVASPRGGGQLPNPNECNSTPTSGTRGIYPQRKILMLMIWVTAYVLSTRVDNSAQATKMFIASSKLGVHQILCNNTDTEANGYLSV